MIEPFLPALINHFLRDTSKLQTQDCCVFLEAIEKMKPLISAQLWEEVHNSVNTFLSNTLSKRDSVNNGDQLATLCRYVAQNAEHYSHANKAQLSSIFQSFDDLTYTISNLLLIYEAKEPLAWEHQLVAPTFAQQTLEAIKNSDADLLALFKRFAADLVLE